MEYFFRGQCRWGEYEKITALFICGEFTGYRERIVLFLGGGKADSFKKFRGMSFGMWIATEIDLHHEETIKEATARLAASQRSKVFWDLNPCSQFAWIYTKYIDDYANKQKEGTMLGGYNYQKFTIYDNITISEQQRQVFISKFAPGTAEYRRKIDGERCASEGLIFQKFADNPSQYTTENKFKNIRFITIGVDFGGNGSKTTFVASAIIGKFEHLGVIADHKIEGGKGTIDADMICRDLLAFYKYIKSEYPSSQIPFIFCDCAEQTLITSIRGAFARNRIPIQICDSYKGKITDRIYALNTLMSQKRFLIQDNCINVRNSLSSQVWDSKKTTQDVRLDDGTIDIDTADALEYSFSKFLTEFDVLYSTIDKKGG